MRSARRGASAQQARPSAAPRTSASAIDIHMLAPGCAHNPILLITSDELAALVAAHRSALGRVPLSLGGSRSAAWMWPSTPSAGWQPVCGLLAHRRTRRGHPEFQMGTWDRLRPRVSPWRRDGALAGQWFRRRNEVLLRGERGATHSNLHFMYSACLCDERSMQLARITRSMGPRHRHRRCRSAAASPPAPPPPPRAPPPARPAFP